MTIIQLLNSDGYIACSKAVIKAIGLTEAAVLGKLCSVAQRFNYQEFYITLDKICEDVNLSEYQVRQTLDTLKSFGIISVTKKGIPCKNYYTIHEDKIIELLDAKNPQTSTKKTSELEPKKLEGKQESSFGTFKVMKKDKKKDMEKENNNIVPPPQEPSSVFSDAPSEQPSFSASSCIQQECLADIQSCHQQLYEKWLGAKLPLSRSSAGSYFIFSCRELKSALGYWSGKGFTSQELLEALDNYIQLAELIRGGGSWMTGVGGFDQFAKHTMDYLDGNFILDNYRKGRSEQRQGTESIEDKTARLVMQWQAEEGN